MLRQENSSADTRGGDLARLLHRCAAGDKNAFSTFYQKTSGSMYGFALGILRDEGRAQECLQDVYLAVWNNASRYHADKSPVMTWLASITHHRAISYLRLYQREVTIDDWIAFMETGADTQGKAALTSSFPGENDWQMLSNQILERCIDDLDEAKRHVVRQAFWGDSNYSDISIQMNSPLTTIKSWVRRALMDLKKCLDHSGKLL